MIDRRRDTTPDEPLLQEIAPLRRRRSTTRLLLGFFGGAVVALMGGVVATVLIYRDPMPVLTEETLSAARTRWDDVGPKSYALEIQILGRQPGLVKLKVRDGVPVEMTRDGRVPEQRRTWAAWTVPSQFDMLATELRGQQNPVLGYSAPAGSQVVLKAEFDPKRGCPLHVRRQVLGTELNVEWRVTKFEAE